FDTCPSSQTISIGSHPLLDRHSHVTPLRTKNGNAGGQQFDNHECQGNHKHLNDAGIRSDRLVSYRRHYWQERNSELSTPRRTEEQEILLIRSEKSNTDQATNEKSTAISRKANGDIVHNEQYPTHDEYGNDKQSAPYSYHHFLCFLRNGFVYT